MTGEEIRELDAWFAACRSKQPAGTLALLLYVRDGRIYLGKSDSAVEAEQFPDSDYIWALGEIIKGLLPLMNGEALSVITPVEAARDAITEANAILREGK